MRAAEQWETIARGLPPDWDEVELAFTAEDARSAAAAAAVLGPLGPGRTGNQLRLRVGRAGGEPERLRNLLRQLDRKRIWGELALLDAREAARLEEAESRQGLAEAWDAALAALPPGWEDLLCEVELDSSDYLPRAALLCSPLNPSRNTEALALRFRVSRRKGYGAAAGLARRCLERLDAERITGRVRVLHTLEDTDDVWTQGPVWRLAGRSV
ncbi:MAG TPA: hypothetical protein VNJ53_11080 [Gaiellaceae bacterium]|nr:hypothetical protein [Gaiellaceae bacterium]